MIAVSSGFGLALHGAASSVPVDPDAPDARQMLLDELARPPYREAQPTWFDRLSEGFLKWLGSLFQGGEGLSANWLPVAAITILAVVLLVAVLVWGVPRLNRRSRKTVSLFGENDGRTAAEMRTAATVAASQSNWPLAIAEQFRALATDLAERTIVSVNPGTTAIDFARAAARALPSEAEALRAASAIFDEVRYLEHPGSEEDYRVVHSLDERVRSAQPAVMEGAGSPLDTFSGVNGGLS